MTIDNMDPADAWNAVAPAWDANIEASEGATEGATRRLLAGVAVRSGDRVLELAAGPGSLGPVWADLVGPAGRVLLSDISPRMVDAARRRNDGLGNLEHAVIDAAAIDLPDASFDVVACRMGLMFTPDPAVALAEIHRVLSHGGRFAALTWAGIEHNPWMTCVGMAAMATGIVSGGPPTGPGGIFSLADPTVLERLAVEAGFADVAITTEPVTFVADSIDTHLHRVASLAGPLAVALQAAPHDQQAAFRRTATELATPYLTGTGVEIPGLALLVTGRR